MKAKKIASRNVQLRIPICMLKTLLKVLMLWALNCVTELRRHKKLINGMQKTRSTISQSQDSNNFNSDSSAQKLTKYTKT